MRMVIVLSGLPGVGKTCVARRVAELVPAVVLEVDEIEASFLRAGFSRSSQTGLAAYIAAEAMAARCLASGVSVVVDAVNAVEEARRAWWDLARRTSSALRVIEVRCSDAEEHRRRVESRHSKFRELRAPTWQEVLDREFEQWREDRLLLDTAATGEPWREPLRRFLESEQPE